MKSILIIEDDGDLSRLWEMAIGMLSLPGVRSETKRDGRSALNRVNEPPAPDVIILDMHLPLVEGQEIYKTARTKKHLSGSKIIIITADKELADRLHDDVKGGRIVPPDEIVIKPIPIEDFQTLIKRMIDGR
jgi:CheY-like chemotaxis protein